MKKEQKIKIAKTVSLFLLATITTIIVYAIIILSIWYYGHSEKALWLCLLLALAITLFAPRWVKSCYYSAKSAFMPEKILPRYVEEW